MSKFETKVCEPAQVIMAVSSKSNRSVNDIRL